MEPMHFLIIDWLVLRTGCPALFVYNAHCTCTLVNKITGSLLDLELEIGICEKNFCLKCSYK